MYRNIFDTHAHYDDERFCEDSQELLSSFAVDGITGVVSCGVNTETSKANIELSEKYPFIYAAVGYHGLNTEDVPENYIDVLSELIKNKKVVATGEIGLDYHYERKTRDFQLEIFIRQIEFANEHNLPVIVHDREAHEDTLKILKELKPKGVLHCFSGSVEMAKEIIKLGMYIGLGGAVTFKNAVKPVEVAAFVPEDRLVLETDAPYMTPVPFRGQRCTSLHIPYTAEKIAEVRGVDTQYLLDITDRNARELFSIK
ncbi:MAG: TatD family hydrolase [Clostridia bacterium]|nr:TatD family hydrolase [Clostridia bacterium]